jgi:phospholipase/carboxylesterase
VNHDDANSSTPADADAAAAQHPPTVWLEPAGEARVAVLWLHGLDMDPAAIAPLLRSLKLPAVVALPAGPVARAGAGRAWWPVDDAKRAARLALGPADLHDSHPAGRDEARRIVHASAAALRARAPGRPLVVAGFSQGAMLALDCVLQAPPLVVEALALCSASRLSFAEWEPALHRLRDVHVQLLHGSRDANLALAAAHALRDALEGAQARVRWSAFDGGHEIPLQAWVGLRRLVRELAQA